MYKYWGDFDSSVIFCEDKFTHSYYVAEYFNTLSGIAYLSVAYYFLTTKVIHYGFLITLMGLGTMTLHGTLRWYGQWADEMSMLTLMFFYIKDVYYDIKYEYCVLLLGTYMTFHDNYGVFLLLFVSLIFYQYKAVQKIIRNKNAKYYIRVYQISMISGGVCWILDRICFTKVVNFHVLWHLLSTIGVYSGTQIYHEHRKDLDKAANKILKWYKINN